MEIRRFIHRDSLLAVLVRASDEPVVGDTTEFVTEDDAQFQIGVITRLAGGEVIPHVHHPIERHVIGTSEALFVAQGSVEVDLYSADRMFLESFSAARGDIIVFMGDGGHGFRFMEDCRLIEVKQGPFVEGIDKEKFTRPGGES